MSKEEKGENSLVAQNSSYTHTNPAVRIFACALEKDHDVQIVETTVNDSGGEMALCEKLYEKKADLYAFSVYIWNRFQQLNTAKMIKKLLPGALVAVGGPEVSFENENFLRENQYVDFLIRGEGERALCDIADGKYLPHTVIDGGVFEGFAASDEPYFCNAHSKGCEDGKLMYYESSRGCPFSCSYCLSSVKRQGERVRAKDSEKVKNELSVLLTHNVKAIKFVDRTFNFDTARAKEIFSFIIGFDEKNGGGCPTCHFEICASLIDDDTVNILSRARPGLIRFEIGVQTATEESLSAIGRRNDTAKIIENVAKLKEKTKVTLHLDLICGLPKDSYDGIKRSFDMIYPFSECLQLGFLKLLPGTKLRNEAKEHGMEYLDFPPYTLYKSDGFSFEELRKLSGIADTAESFSEKEGSFCKSIGFLIGKSGSPFEFYEKLSSFLSSRQGLSPRAKYTALYDFACELSEDEKRSLCEYLRYDFLTSNQGKPPLAVERRYTDGERAELEAVRKTVIHESPKNEGNWFVPALETHLFDFDSGNVYIIDRKNHRVETRKRG